MREFSSRLMTACAIIMVIFIALYLFIDELTRAQAASLALVPTLTFGAARVLHERTEDAEPPPGYREWLAALRKQYRSSTGQFRTSFDAQQREAEYLRSGGGAQFLAQQQKR